MSQVKSKPIEWIWLDYIPRGKLTSCDGDPGLGKSLIALYIAARLSVGQSMPDGAKNDLQEREPAGVVILSAEDDPEDTIRPRLEAVKADLTRIVMLSAVRESAGTRLPTLADLKPIRQAIRHVSARLVIIDPLMAFLPGRVDAHRDQDVRQSLALLTALAAEMGVAVLVIRHLNKAVGGNPLYRGGGSIGIIGAARSGLLVAKEPSDINGEKRILAVTKANLAKLPPALAYRVEATGKGVPFITWHGTTQHTAAILLAQQGDDEDRSALDEAADFLRTALAKGPRSAKEVQREAEQAGVSAITLRRARIKLGVKPAKTGRPGDSDQHWQWGLPPKVLKSTEAAHQKSMSSFGEEEHLREGEADSDASRGEVQKLSADDREVFE